MTTISTGELDSHAAATERSRHTGAQRALMTLEAFISVSAIGGGIYLITNPLTAMPINFLEETPFNTWVVPGIALIFFVGVLPAAVAVMEMRHVPITQWAHLGVGVGLLAWIGVEAAWIVVEPALQIPIAALGAVVSALAVINLRRKR